MKPLYTFFPPRNRVFLYSPGDPVTHSVDQASLKLRNPPSSASQVLRLPPLPRTFAHFYSLHHHEGNAYWSETLNILPMVKPFQISQVVIMKVLIL